MPGKVNPVIPEVVLQVAAQVIGNDTAITDRRHAGPVRAQRPHPAHRAQPAAVDPPALDRVGRLRREVRRRHRGQQGGRQALGRVDARRRPPRSTSTSATTRARRSSRRPSESGRPLRDVALEEGVDAELYDRVIDLRKIAAGQSTRRTARAPARRAATEPRGASRLSAPATRRAPHRGDRRLRLAVVGEQALLVDPAHEVDVGHLAADRAAGERRREREVLEVPDELAVEPRGRLVGADVAGRAGSPGSSPSRGAPRRR